jgi:WD40 repeat protein
MTVGLIALILLAACQTADTPEDDEFRRGATLPPPPAWLEADAALTLENIVNARLLGRLDAPGPTSTVFAHNFSPDGTQLAGLNNSILVVWDLITGRVVFNAPREDAIMVFFSSDKTRVFTVNSIGLTTVYNAENGQLLTDFEGHQFFSQVAAYADDIDQLALGGLEGQVRVWDVFERRSLTIETSGSDLTALAFSPDGSLLATGDALGNAQVWDWAAQERRANLQPEGPGMVVGLTFSPDGAQLAVAQDNAVGLYSVAESVQVHTLGIGMGGASDVLLYSPAGQYLVTGGVTPDVSIWDTTSGGRAVTLPGFGADRVSAAFSPDGRLLVTSVLSGSVALWDMTSIDAGSIRSANLEIGLERVLYVNWSPDGYLITFFADIGPINVWGVNTADPEAEEGATGG